MDEVNEISTGGQQSSGNGRVFVVDPNPTKDGVLPAEDMFIYVKLSAYPKNRVTYNGDGFSSFGVEDEVNFISSKIRYDQDGKLNPKPQDTYATTDWTQIGSFKNADTVSSGVLEGFGIKSISIKYDASLVPKVDVTFTDLRGGGLFDTITNNDILSPYSLFFKMPYPVFKLSVKGYFGQNVDYCLHMFNWTSQFDGSTGNFDITANFLGFQQAFLNDMVLGNIIGVVNTKEGNGKLNEIFNRSTNEDIVNTDQNTRRLDDFFLKIASLNTESEKLKLDSDNFKLLKFLNGKLNILEQISGFVGKPLPKDQNNQVKENNTPENYLKIKNAKSLISTTSINDSILSISKNYWSIRDFLLVNIVNLSEFKSYVNALNDVVITYQEYIASNDETKTKAVKTLQKLKNSTNDKQGNKKSDISSVLNYIKPKQDDLEFIGLFDLNDVNDNSWQNFVIPVQVSDITNNNFILSNVLESMYTENTSLDIYLKNNYEEDKSGVNTEFEIEVFKNVVDNGDFYNATMLPQTKVLVVDFRRVRAVLEKEIVNLKNVIKSQKEIVQKEINDELFKNFLQSNKFIPTIRNCFDIIANNTQAMVETVYEITKKSEDESIATNRRAILSSFETDIPPNLLNNNSKGVAWPTIYRKNSDQSREEVYVGDLNGVNRENFPEYDFVERVFDNFTKKREKLNQVTINSIAGVDTDNWFPINPIDYEINPFISFPGYNDESSLVEDLVTTSLERVGILDNYSNFTNQTGSKSVSTYGEFDALILYEILKTDNNKLLLVKNVLERMVSTKPFYENELYTNSKFFKENIEIVTSPLNVPTSIIKNNFNFGEYLIGEDYTNPNIDYVLFDVNDIINNSKNIIDSIKQNDEYNDITDPNGRTTSIKKDGGSYYQNYYYNNNFTTNNILNVWDKKVNSNLYKRNGDKITLNFNNSKISDIDISGITDGIYLNKTNFNPEETTTDYEELLIEGEFYSQQSKFGKSLLLLSSFPFRDFKSGFLDSVFEGDAFVGARIVKLPALYVYYLGGLLWRYNESVDPIIFSGDYNKFATPKDSYLSKITYYGYNSDPDKTKIEVKPLENNLKNLPVSVKNAFINEFKNWTRKNFGSNSNPGKFEINMSYYSNDAYSGTTSQLKSDGTEVVLKEIRKIKDLIILNPVVFNGKTTQLDFVISNTSYSSYIDKFKSTFDTLVKNVGNVNKNTEEEEKSKNNNSIQKLEIYNYFKNINNKWITDNQNGRAFSICGGDGSNSRDLFEYFKFIDRGWRDIGNDVTINLKSFNSISNDFNTSIYLFMSKVLRDNNFLFQILPTYINYKDAEEVSKIFKPQTNITNNKSSGPLFCGIYIGGVSEYLDIKERDNYHFNNDGWSFNGGDIPEDMLDNKKANDTGSDDYSLVAFRVAFGAQNQTIFKDVSLNQQEHKETAEYFAVLSDEIDKRGATQPSYIGTNLLRMFKTRSYTCSINALGCMNIQPLMYFDLQNVPFFNGAYLITSVDHNITPNHMTTSFKGLRQSKYQTKPTTNVVSNLDIDLNETDSTPEIVFTNLNTTDILFRIGLRDEIADQPFDFTQINQTNLDLLGVPRGVVNEVNIPSIVNKIKSAGIASNSEVTMFLTNMLSQSNNLQTKQISFDDGNYQDSEVIFDNNSPFSGETKRYQNSSIEVVTGTSNNYFTYIPTLSADTSEIEKEDYAYYFNGTDSRLSEYTKVTFSASTGELLTDLNTLRYYNIYKGDAQMYRPAGYLYMVGRKQYYDLFGEDAIKNPQKYYKDNSKSLDIAIKVWKNIKDGVSGKTASEYSKMANPTGNKGSNSIFEKTRKTCQHYQPKPIDDTAKIFRRVLETFRSKEDNLPLIDYFNP
jgi:hypothetical protein